MPTAGDSHMCEYLAYTHDPVTKPWEKYYLQLQSWEGNRKRRAEWCALAHDLVNGVVPLDQLKNLSRFAILDEPVPEMIEAITFNDNFYTGQLNIPNNGGLIPNLPVDAIVEVPGVLSGTGI